MIEGGEGADQHLVVKKSGRPNHCNVKRVIVLASQARNDSRRIQKLVTEVYEVKNGLFRYRVVR